MLSEIKKMRGKNMRTDHFEVVNLNGYTFTIRHFKRGAWNVSLRYSFDMKCNAICSTRMECIQIINDYAGATHSLSNSIFMEV